MNDIRLSPTAAPKPGTPRDILHRMIEDHHDEHHYTLPYADCSDCTIVHVFFTDNPRLVEKL